MLTRVLVLLFAIVLIAAGTERMSAEVCSDPVADIVDEATVVHVADIVLPPPCSAIELAYPPRNRIPPAPVLLRVFRPPRSVRV